MDILVEKKPLREVFIRESALNGIEAGKAAAKALIEETKAARIRVARKAYYTSNGLKVILAGAVLSLLAIVFLGQSFGLVLDWALKTWFIVFFIIGVLSFFFWGADFDYEPVELRSLVDHWASPFDGSFTHESFYNALMEHPDFKVEVGQAGITRAHYSLFEDFLDAVKLAEAAEKAAEKAEAIRQELIRRTQEQS